MANEKSEWKQRDPSRRTTDAQVASEPGQGGVPEKELEKVVGGSPRDPRNGLPTGK